MSRTDIPGQLGFDAMLSEARDQNRAREFERETAHLPATMEKAVPFYRSLLGEHHAAMTACDVERVFALRGPLTDLLAGHTAFGYQTVEVGSLVVARPLRPLVSDSSTPVFRVPFSTCTKPGAERNPEPRVCPLGARDMWRWPYRDQLERPRVRAQQLRRLPGATTHAD